jgi:hypothetical protein
MGADSLEEHYVVSKANDGMSRCCANRPTQNHLLVGVHVLPQNIFRAARSCEC